MAKDVTNDGLCFERPLSQYCGGGSCRYLSMSQVGGEIRHVDQCHVDGDYGRLADGKWRL